MEYTSEDYFSADSNTIDSLKLEYSSLSPAEESLVKDLANNISEVIKKKYSQYIHPDLLIKLEDVSNRVLVISGDDYKKFEEEWKPAAERRTQTESAGKYLLIGDFVFMRDMKEEAQKFYDKHKESFELPNPTSREALITAVQYSLVIATMIHEFTHYAQREYNETSLTGNIRQIALSECGTSYITSQVLEEYYPRVIPSDTEFEDKRIGLFATILDKYGDNAYFIFFNRKPEHMTLSEFNLTKEKIFSEFDSRILLDIGIIKEDQVDAFDYLLKAGS